MDFWMVRAQESGLVPLVDTVKHTYNKVSHTVFTPGKHLDPWKYILPL